MFLFQCAHSIQDDGVAAQKVFDTTELLEEILQYLPTRDLLLNQRVCTTWKNCIDNSIKLQRALFFRPVGEPVVPQEYDGPCGISNGCEFSEAHYHIPATKISINRPLYNMMDVEDFVHLISGQLNESALSARMQYSKASWRRMLPTQPQVLGIEPPTVCYESDSFDWTEEELEALADLNDGVQNEFFLTLHMAILRAEKDALERRDFWGTGDFEFAFLKPRRESV